MTIREHIKKILREEISSTPTKYTYLTMNPFNKGITKRYYFNDIVAVDDPKPVPGKTKIEGADGDFIFDTNTLRFDLGKKNVFISQDEFNKRYPGHHKVNKPEVVGINSKNIKLALQKAFPENWKSDSNIFSAGLRGIYTIGEKIDDPNEDWSVMNFFDTKKEIHSLIYLRYHEDDTQMNIVDWMADVFKNDDEFVELLVDRQWQSIKNGILNEKMATEAILNKLGGGNVVLYPFGSKMDRFGGVDFTINGVNYQIKPLSRYKKEPNGQYVISTYGMQDYTKKPSLDKIVFYSPKECLIFNNENYDVPNNYTAVFNEEPEII